MAATLDPEYCTWRDGLGPPQASFDPARLSVAPDWNRLSADIEW